MFGRRDKGKGFDCQRSHPISDRPRILLLFGPTASGKTSAAVRLAKHLDGEVVNADSMQVYAGLPVLTAIPDMAERENVPHHLFGSIDPANRFSVGKWAQAALDCVQDIQTRGKTPILVGGTGLYFEALTKGLAEMPEIPQSRLDALQEELQTKGSAILHARLAGLDPETANRLAKGDSQRIVRALSVVEETGRTLGQWQADTQAALDPDDWRGAMLLPDREALYARINARFDAMVETGALEELRAFMTQHGKHGLSLHKAVGVPPLMQYLQGEVDLDSAMDLAKRDTRRYAKRQMTWGRNRMADWPVFSDADALVNAFTI